MLYRSIRSSSVGNIREAFFSALRTGRKRRQDRKRTRPSQPAQVFESLEDRALLSVQQVLAGLGSGAGEESHNHAVFAPGTSQEYIDSIGDDHDAASDGSTSSPPP